MPTHPDPRPGDDRASQGAGGPLEGKPCDAPKKPRAKRVRCPLCRKGAGRLPAGASGGGLPASPERECVLCSGSGTIHDRQKRLTVPVAFHRSDVTEAMRRGGRTGPQVQFTREACSSVVELIIDPDAPNPQRFFLSTDALAFVAAVLGRTQ